MNRIRRFLGIVLACAMMSYAFMAMGCEGTETKDKADKTVEKFAGKDKVELMKKMQTDVQKSMDKEAERLKETE